MANPTPSQPEPTLQMEVEQADDLVLVRLAGSINMDVGEELRDKLLELVETTSQAVVIDLSQLQFISSLGLSGMIAAHIRSRDKEGGIMLVAPPPSIAELLEVTRLTSLMPVFDSVDAARAARS